MYLVIFIIFQIRPSFNPYTFRPLGETGVFIGSGAYLDPPQMIFEMVTNESWPLGMRQVWPSADYLPPMTTIKLYLGAAAMAIVVS